MDLDQLKEQLRDAVTACPSDSFVIARAASGEIRTRVVAFRDFDKIEEPIRTEMIAAMRDEHGKAPDPENFRSQMLWAVGEKDDRPWDVDANRWAFLFAGDAPAALIKFASA